MSVVISAEVAEQIRAEFSFTANHGVLGESKLGTSAADWTGLDRMHMHVLVLRDFPNVVGQAYWVGNITEHNAHLAAHMARTDAINQVTSLLDNKRATDAALIAK